MGLETIVRNRSPVRAPSVGSSSAGDPIKARLGILTGKHPITLGVCGIGSPDPESWQK